MMTTELQSLLRDADSAFQHAAVDAQLVDVAVRTTASPVGPLLIAATDEGIVRVAFENEGFDAVIEQLATRVSPRLVEAPSTLLDAAVDQLARYFDDGAATFDLPLDMRLSTGAFRSEVLRLLSTIPAGSTRTYQQMAADAGRPTAVRAVGTSCATNPVPIIVACHRIVRADGTAGGYLGGLDAKRWLLNHELAAAS